MKVVLGKGIYLALRTLQQLVLHQCLVVLIHVVGHLDCVLFLAVGRFYGFCLEVVPVEVGEPGVGFYLFYALLAAHAVRWGSDYQLVHEICGLDRPSMRHLALLDEVLLR